MKILHTADCHLDSVMESHLPSSTARARRSELLLTFRNVVEGAAVGGVRVILISGDLFDTKAPQASTLAYVLSTVKAYPDIQFILIEGNHDAGAISKADCPENLLLARRGEIKELCLDDVSFYAVGYGAESERIASLPLDPARKNIMLAHGTLGYEGDEREEILSRALIERLPIDYLALGHYHGYRLEKISERTTACYAGTPEGRGFDEAGPHGVVLLESDTMKAEFLLSAKRTLHRLSLDISAAATQRDIENELLSLIEGISSEDMVHVTLTGHYRETLLMDLGILKSLLTTRFYFARLKDESAIAIRPEDYKNDVSLRGEFVRAVLSKNLSDEDKSRILTYGLRSLCKENPES